MTELSVARRTTLVRPRCPNGGRRRRSRLAARLLVACMVLGGTLGCAARHVPAPATGEGPWEGGASWYGIEFHGRRAADGSRYNMYELTAAHRTLPLGSRVKVTNLSNGRTVKVTITDRGPFVEGRIIDLSYSAAQQLGMLGAGVTRVRVELID